MNRRKEKHALIGQVVLNGYDLSYLESFKALQSKYPDDEDIRITSFIWMAIIHDENGHLIKALDIFYNLLRKEEFSSLQLQNILMDTFKILIKLDRKEEAIELVEKYHVDERIDPLSYVSPLLFWYVDELAPLELDLAKYDQLLDYAMDKLGYHSKMVDRKAKIREIHWINHNTSMKYENVLTKVKGKAKEEQILGLREFVATDPPSLYKKIANKKIETLSKL
ncbi:hypothetical protein DN752_08260 [Echinicola strongylocentroti]|uniref:Tetratricopeptide repeat protein n=1 Tax=Echinicola strongylocentroti TaxID=1795355 RepID=A0A2Z4IHE0_9BACT|nr:hypothetical protein [Echinicola strongylocentroti]AWW30117.1 hypothetical protein DN752_08260 [Echinicola strongylocentroti]